ELNQVVMTAQRECARPAALVDEALRATAVRGRIDAFDAGLQPQFEGKAPSALVVDRGVADEHDPGDRLSDRPLLRRGDADKRQEGQRDRSDRLSHFPFRSSPFTRTLVRTTSRTACMMSGFATPSNVQSLMRMFAIGDRS